MGCGSRGWRPDSGSNTGQHPSGYTKEAGQEAKSVREGYDAELCIQWAKDLKRSIDYLETRPEFDRQKIAYEGMSAGGVFGFIIPAVEERLKASVLIGGSMNGIGRPEIDEVNFIGRVKIPTLMLNGRYDTINPVEKCIKPAYDLLGTPAKDKKLILYETDHIPPVNEMIKETLAWLDRYLGPVK